MNISKSGVGMYASVFMLLLNTLGIEADQGTVEGVITSGITIVAFGTWMYGQLSRKDLHFGLFRKQQ